jgi:hypothetical protein
MTDPVYIDAEGLALLAQHSWLLLHTAIAGDRDVGIEVSRHALEQLCATAFHRLRAYTTGGRIRFTTSWVVMARRSCLDHRRAVGALRFPTWA